MQLQHNEGTNSETLSFFFIQKQQIFLKLCNYQVLFFFSFVFLFFHFVSASQALLPLTHNKNVVGLHFQLIPPKCLQCFFGFWDLILFVLTSFIIAVIIVFVIVIITPALAVNGYSPQVPVDFKVTKHPFRSPLSWVAIQGNNRGK